MAFYSLRSERVLCEQLPTVCTSPRDSRMERSSRTVIGGALSPAAWAITARMTAPESRESKWSTKVSGCCASTSQGAKASAGKSLKLVVTMTCALHLIAAARTCRSSSSGSV